MIKLYRKPLVVWQYSWSRPTSLDKVLPQTATLSSVFTIGLKNVWKLSGTSASWLRISVMLCAVGYEFGSKSIMWMSLPPPKKVMFLVRSVCLFVCLSIGLLASLWTDFDKFFGGVGHGSRTEWYNFGGDLDHASDPGVQSLKSRSSGSAEVCALWVLLVAY